MVMDHRGGPTHDRYHYIASDIMAIGEYSEKYFVLPEFSIAEISEKLTAAENAEEQRVKGELLTANLYRIERGAK